MSVRIGISSCLLGESVRYNGGHKRDVFLTEVFGSYVEWVSVCPEVEMGLGVPRESMRLVDENGHVRLVAEASGTDHTQQMTDWTKMRIAQLESQDLSGYIFKGNSPSCGLERLKVYRRSGVLHAKGTGLFARVMLQHFPHLPVEEEGRLNDPRLRENFISSVFSYKRWTDMTRQKLSRAAIMDFHAKHKFLLMAHSQSGARQLGALIGKSSRSATLKKLADEYLSAFAAVMRRTPTRRNHTNVLQHLAGYVSEHLAGPDRQELTDLIDRYRQEQVPLIVPITLLRHYVRKYSVEYLHGQIYLDPHPQELMLLNRL